MITAICQLSLRTNNNYNNIVMSVSSRFPIWATLEAPRPYTCGAVTLTCFVYAFLRCIRYLWYIRYSMNIPTWGRRGIIKFRYRITRRISYDCNTQNNVITHEIRNNRLLCWQCWHCWQTNRLNGKRRVDVIVKFFARITLKKKM